MPESNPNQQLTPIDFHHLCPISEKEQKEVSVRLMEVMSCMDSKDLSAVHAFKDGLLTLGADQQESFWQTNNRLIHPLQQLMTDTREGGEVARLLKSLHKKVSAIQPPNGKPSWMERFLLLFSLKDSAWDMWLESYPEKKKEVLLLVDKLSSAKKQLKRDNLILTDDQSVLETEMKKLQSAYDWISGFEAWLKQNLQNTDLENHDLILDEFLPAVQRRSIELQQQLLIARQSVMTVELIIKQNQSLIRGIDHSIYTTTSAMNVTVSLALLKNKKEKSQFKENAEKLKHAQNAIDNTLDEAIALNQESSSALTSLSSHSEGP